MEEAFPNDHVASPHENALSARWAFTVRMSRRLLRCHPRAQGSGTANGWLLVKHFLNSERCGTLTFVDGPQ